jgi:hypothetical protein
MIFGLIVQTQAWRVQISQVQMCQEGNTRRARGASTHSDAAEVLATLTELVVRAIIAYVARQDFIGI